VGVTTGSARASVERVVAAIDDRPLSLYGKAGYGAADRGAYGAIGVRVGVVARPAAPR
jgi:hypothetical protein